MTEWWANVYVYTHVDHGKFCEGAKRRLSRFRAELEAEEALDRNRFRIHVRLKPGCAAPTSPSKSLGEEASPCNWGGGNDIVWCSTCGAEYAYAKSEQRPACPHRSGEEA